MNVADHAISLEAKKDALAQRQSGDWKISFTVQGTDMDPRLTKAAMGTRFAMVLVEIGDDELPVPAKESRATPRQASSPSIPTGGAKRMDWREVQPAAQAGIRCADPIFIAFLKDTYAAYWMNYEDAAATVRDICAVDSRSELSTDHRKRVLWHQLDNQFQAWQAKERVGV